MSSEPMLVPHRNAGNAAAVVFIHGFAGKPQKTWGDFPKFIQEDAELSDWDVFGFGYSTSLLPDIVGIWSADASIDTLANLLKITASARPMDGYKSIAFLAHSMGGLIAQHALMDERLGNRISHLLLFGTPSAGLSKSSIFSFWKRQLRDMAADSDFIRDLRNRWEGKFRQGTPFTFRTIAGERDEFVPASSSLGPFPEDTRAVVPGDHREIVKPESSDSLSFQCASRALSGREAPAGLGSGAQLAIEMRQFREAIRLLEAGQADLDEKGLVQLALALESVGRQEDAIAMLMKIKSRKFTDAMGVLAGRLKRRWYVERRKKDVEMAYALYHKAYKLSVQKRDVQQSFYHGINLAYFDVAYKGNVASARRKAKTVLEFCRKARTKDHWLYATIADANLILGRAEPALENYKRALVDHPSPREVGSIYQQAARLADVLGNADAGKDIRELFEAEWSPAT